MSQYDGGLWEEPTGSQSMGAVARGHNIITSYGHSYFRFSNYTTIPFRELQSHWNLEGIFWDVLPIQDRTVSAIRTAYVIKQYYYHEVNKNHNASVLLLLV